MPEKIEKRAVEQQDLFRLKFIQEPSFSPDGKYVLYLTVHVDPQKEEELSTIFLYTVKTGHSRSLTSDQHHDFNPVWSPDSKQVAFASARGGKPQVYSIAVDGGEARPLTTLKQGVVGDLAWSPDGKWLVFTAGPEEPPDLTKPYRVTRKIYRMDNVGYVDVMKQDLYLVSSAGGDAKRLTSDAFSNGSPLWSPDSREVYYLAALNPDRYQFYTDIRVVDLEGQSREILSQWGGVQGLCITRDGKKLYFVGSNYDRPIGVRSQLWMLDSKSGEPEERTSTFPWWVGHGVGGDMPARFATKIILDQEEQSALIHIQRGGNVHIYRFSLNGPESWEPLVTGDERTCFLVDSSEQKLLFASSNLNNPVDLYLCDWDGTQEKRITQVNEALISTWKLPQVEHFFYPGEYGDPIESWYMKPVAGKAPYPTVLYIHGGPQGAYGFAFSFDFQMLAGAGYGVLFTNPRGSTGYTDEFVLQLKKRWGDIDYKDVMAGVDYAIGQGLVDPDHMGVYGLSYGGYLSTWIITQTDRFKAAIPENPVTDLMTEYGVNDFDPWASPDEFGGKPHECPDIYWKESPIAYAHQCRTPTLLIQSENDFRCPKNQSEQFYTMLKAGGCLVEMVRMPNSFHVASIAGAPIMRRVANEVFLDWLDRFVLGITCPEHKPSV